MSAGFFVCRGFQNRRAFCPQGVLSWIRAYRRHIMNTYISVYHFYQAAVAVKISNLLNWFCSFDLSCPILEKDMYLYCIVLSY